MKMAGFDVYRTYLALKSHFRTERYDYFKFRGRASKQSFFRRKDRYFFEKLARRFSGDRSLEMIDFFVANFILDESLWIGDALNEDAERHYLEWCRRNQSLDYIFESDCETILTLIEKEEITFNDLFECPPRQHPVLLKLMMNGSICIETFIILNDMLGFFNKWNKQMPDDYIWQEIRRRCGKYTPFLSVLDLGKKKYQLVVKTKLIEHGLLT